MEATIVDKSNVINGSIKNNSHVTKPKKHSKLKKFFIFLGAAVALAGSGVGAKIAIDTANPNEQTIAEIDAQNNPANVVQFAKDVNQSVLSKIRDLAYISGANYSFNESYSSIQSLIIQRQSLSLTVNRLDASGTKHIDEIVIDLNAVAERDDNLPSKLESNLKEFIEYSGTGSATQAQQDKCLALVKDLMKDLQYTEVAVRTFNGLGNNTILCNVSQKIINAYINTQNMDPQEINEYVSNLNASTHFYYVKESVGHQSSLSIVNTIILNNSGILKTTFNVTSQGRNCDINSALDAINDEYLNEEDNENFVVNTSETTYTSLSEKSVGQAFIIVNGEQEEKYNKNAKSAEQQP